ncbi:MAG: hypothetical protein ACRDNT_15135 [Streptosporangiaceae bacterium]
MEVAGELVVEDSGADRQQQVSTTQETGEDGKRRYTAAEIAAEFGVTRPAIYRHLTSAAGWQCRRGAEVLRG